MLLVCIFSISSCAVVPAYHALDLIAILEAREYEITDVNHEVQEGITGYIYGSREDSNDEIYYIYCKNLRSAKSVYDYVNSRHKARIAELKMEIDKIEYVLHKSEGVSAAEKGDYYERLVINSEELEKIQSYSCGHGFNVVWYGTKQAIMDLRLGGQSK